MKKNKKKLLPILFAAALAWGTLFPQVNLDVKTTFKDKSHLKGIKGAVIYFLEKRGYQVVEVGEHYAVWLVDFRENRKGPDRYTAKLVVKITRPTLFRQKKAIVSGEVKVEYRFRPEPVNVDDSRFLEFFKKKYGNMTKKEITRAFHVGRAAAKEVRLLLLAAKLGKKEKI